LAEGRGHRHRFGLDGRIEQRRNIRRNGEGGAPQGRRPQDHGPQDHGPQGGHDPQGRGEGSGGGQGPPQGGGEEGGSGRGQGLEEGCPEEGGGEEGRSGQGRPRQGGEGRRQPEAGPPQGLTFDSAGPSGGIVLTPDGYRYFDPQEPSRSSSSISTYQASAQSRQR